MGRGGGRGGKGTNGRGGVVCACLFRLGGPHPVPLALVRPGAQPDEQNGFLVTDSCAPCSALSSGLEPRRGNKTIGTPNKNCLPGLPVIVSGGWLACGKER